MAATIWMPPLNDHRRTWWLLDGSTIIEPEIEESSSRRRARIKGEKKSFPFDELWAQRLKRVIAMAADRGTNVLCEKRSHSEPLADGRHEVLVEETSTDLYLLSNPSQSDWIPDPGRVTLWWNFTTQDHPGVWARLEVGLRDSMGHYRAPGAVRLVSVNLHHNAFVDTPNPGNGQTQILTGIPGRLEPGQVKDFARRAGVDPADAMWPYELSPTVEQRFVRDDRAAIQELLRLVRVVDQHEDLLLPNPYATGFGVEPVFFRMELVGTNYSPDLNEDYATATSLDPARIRRAQAALKEFRKELGGLGLVLGDLRDSDFMRVLSSPDARLEVDVATPKFSGMVGQKSFWNDDPVAVPDDHRVTFDLVSGHLLVHCDKEAISKTEVLEAAADRWQEAVAIASISGEVDTLVEFARQRVRETRSQREEQVVRHLK